MAKPFWSIENDTLVWHVADGEPHTDDIEMSGLRCDYIVSYGVKTDGSLALSQKCFFPALRTIPNNTHATYCFALGEDERVRLRRNGEYVREYPEFFRFDGVLAVESKTDGKARIVRRFFPSVDRRFAVELVRITAEEAAEWSLSAPAESVYAYGRGTKGVYLSKIYHSAPDTMILSAGESVEFGIFYTAVIANETLLPPDGCVELEKRMARVAALCDGSLVLRTGNAELDTMTRFAKLRAGESIFETLTGKYHSPGGQAYYAAIWCNDEIEYAGPHFAMTGDPTALEASRNAYRAYIPFMSDSYIPLPSSIIAEGLDIWEGAGDRGDAAMYLYGASLFCLYAGDGAIARELFGAIRWCAEYCERRKTPEGVIRSDSDELEGRFPTDGYANLSTSCLCYGGLRFAAKLAASLNEDATAALYEARAEALGEAIERYFGATLHGFETYRYSKGFDTLRAWICLPLCMGLTNRADGTLDAMLSPYLWTEEGMRTSEKSAESADNTIWDRSTLYGFKCAFLAGAGDRIMKPFLNYCHKRLVCDRVPYAVEAYPEGGKRHLSGESALFVRIITEGLFGIRPEGLHSFSFTAALPAALPEMRLSAVRICGASYDIEIGRTKWTVRRDGRVLACGRTNGERVFID